MLSSCQQTLAKSSKLMSYNIRS